MTLPCLHRPTTYPDKAMTDQSEATPQNLYQITGNVADMNTVLIERAELRRLQAENDGVQALIAVHQRMLERCLELKAECAELEAMLDAVGAGGVGQSIKPPVQADTAPAAWAIFTRAGFCRMWSQDRALVERTAAELGVKAEPLYRCTGRTRQALKQGEQVAPYTGDVARIMREAGMTFHLGLPHKAVVEQMTRVVDLVYAEASIKAAVAFAAPQPAAQPDTAPAAWAIFSKDGTAMVMWSRDMPSAKNTAEKLGLPLVPLYTAPQPARKPLTDEQIIEIADKTQTAEPGTDGYILPISFARAIEQAHSITGGQ